MEGFGVQGAPCAAHVVADIFAETDGFGATFFGCVEEAGLHEEAPNGDYGARFPGFLHFARFPEEGEDVLSFFVRVCV